MQINLDAIFASALSPYVLVDTDLRMVWANEAYLRVTGRTRDRLIGRRMTDEFPAPEDSVSDKMLRGSFRKVFETGEPDHLPLIPYPIENADGTVEDRYWSATHTPILGADGSVEYILQNTMDVTGIYRGEDGGGIEYLRERVAMIERAEAVANKNLALETMTEFFKSTFDQAPSFMAVLDGPDHVFKMANRTYIDLIGQREIIGLTVREALPDIAGQGFFELLDQVYTSGEPVSFKGMPATLQATPDAEPEKFYVDFMFHPLKDADGNVTGIFVQGHDVTRQKTAEANLAATREKFRTMAQSMPNHVWTADKDGSLNWLNDRTYEFTGETEGTLYGPNWVKVVHPDDVDIAVAAWTYSIENEVNYETEFRIRKADGSYRWHIVRASLLRADDGSLSGWVGTNTDIEERKTSEEQIERLNATLETRVARRNRELEELHATLRQSQKMEAIGGLAGGIAHDFNNLLQVVTGNLQMISREIEEGSPAQERLEQATKSVSRGAMLASQLLSFARKQPLSPVPLNLADLLAENTDILGSAVGEGVELVTIVPDGLWNTNIDPNNMENALLNLAINARDAMDGQGCLTIELANAEFDEKYAASHPVVDAGQYVAISVRDTGCGMPPEIVEKIFEPFFTTKEDGHGTGLGLSMVYGFAKQSGGHITITSAVGSGTVINIYLPRTLKEVQSGNLTDAERVMYGTETILMVEDDDEVRETARLMLEDLGYGVLPAADADEALTILDRIHNIDLLFTDVVMPGKTNGQELAKQIQEIRPDMPVLFTSGYVQDAIVHDGRLDEGVQLLSKPYTQSELQRKIRQVLDAAYPPETDQTETRDKVQEAEPSQGSATAGERVEQGGTASDYSILVCEDDFLILTDIAEGLREAGYTVFEATNGADALQVLQEQNVNALVTDVGLPGQSGEELATQARAGFPDLPVVFATGGVEVPAAEVLGNCLVLTKPFQETQLREALEGLLNKAAAAE
ncbi:hybrid sensor histidine kinase/response regulator [Neptunicoccus cionae]|uniref:hybrid sensor histidine kinase/response regulator n=1 Tax=Neptunicoccus cionae TaxID=2035344 RepID=UPI000C76EFC8|nr:response regulator [Amylibacter cionae]PLS22509.1 hybrid sensor histidine kinase/response regulator [Amylibacter cionae]